MATNWIRRKKRLRAYARKHKIAIPTGFRVGINGYGAAAKKLVRAVKKKAGLRANNALWTRGLQRLLFPLSYGQLVANVVKAKIGVHEKGYSNSGKWVDIFLKAVYLTGGYAWCAAFAIWGQIRAAIINDILDDTKNDYEELRDIMHDLFYGNAAYVPNLHNACKARRKAHGWKTKTVAWRFVKAGDLIFCFNDGHVETATGKRYKKNGAWYVPTVGGNTSDDGSQDNGGEVCEKERRIGTEATGAGRIIPPKS